MSTWRSLGFSGILMGVIGLSVVLPGCGSGGGAGDTAGPNPEVQIVPPTDAQGNAFPITDEAEKK
ncbi:hypothetical protein V5E97_03630 [Singulisphaera sp. Ch08]|uniref:Uncharacterized protein n=1 Tax=Singulisphaera sp. Ch08 TaxID=3120278 RepID=A0AAU7CHX6_9BACT